MSAQRPPPRRGAGAERRSDRNAGDHEAEALRTVRIAQGAAEAREAHDRVLLAMGIGDRHARCIGDGVDLHLKRHFGRRRRAVGFLRRGAQGEVEFAGKVLRRNDREVGQIGGRDAPAAVGLPRAVGERSPFGNTEDLDRQQLRAIGVGEDRGQIQSDRPILLPLRIVRLNQRRIGGDVLRLFSRRLVGRPLRNDDLVVRTIGAGIHDLRGERPQPRRCQAHSSTSPRK